MFFIGPQHDERWTQIACGRVCSEWIQRLSKRRAQDMLIRAAASAAAGELTVDDNRGDAADAELLRFGGSLGLMHVVDHDLVRRTGYSFHQFDGFLASGTACAEDFDFLLCGHSGLLRSFLEFLLTTVGTDCGIFRGIPTGPCIPERSDYQ